ncbi:MAG: OmpA family protein [Kiritimatiellae bacterium]|nr:OmpA family protein [Kiritimatiellia bacterium]
MKRSAKYSLPLTLAISMLLALVLTGTTHAQAETPLDAPWYMSAGLGYLIFEGDEELESGMTVNFRLGYDYSDMWAFEAGFYIAPQLDVGTHGQTTIDNGEVVYEPDVSNSDSDASDSTAFGINIDGLFHFTRFERIDPYLTLGAGATWYEEKVNGNTFDPSIRIGAGVMYHFNDVWSIRLDGRTFIAGNDTEANAMVDAGVVWTWGAAVPPIIIGEGNILDTDHDGLSDKDEERLGTDPYHPDSDRDGLKDGPEVHTYQTDPLNHDSDWDGLKDGPEVHTHKTDPTMRDTDNGGVADGHEVIEDNTNPLDPSDDLQLFELDLKFDYNKSVIKPQYFAALDKIGLVLSRNKPYTARIEGHADRKKGSKVIYNKKLSERRARAVMNYIADKHAIKRSRMKAVGYGFSRPKAKNNPKAGNPINRRVEVYIRKGNAPAAGQMLTTDPENK